MAIQLPRDIGFNLPGWRRVVDAIIQLVEGRHNATGTVKLTASATTTIVSHPNCSKGSVPLLSPMTANAAAAISTTYISAVNQGSFTITHASAASTDRDFRYMVGGG